ncbi:ACT domain-containing family protein, partial [Striga asiatica]
VFIRHVDRTSISSERVFFCLQAAIERRHLRLQLCADDRIDLLADMMRNFPENGINIDRVEISTARNVFYVPNAVGILADWEIIVSVREKICLVNLKIIAFLSSCGRKIEREGSRMLMSLGAWWA